MRVRFVLILAIVSLVALLVPARSSAEWRPAGIRPTAASLGEVFDAYLTAVGKADAGFNRRRERWTYANGDHRLAVDVAVVGDDFRTTIALGTAVYTAGRHQGERWRGDANGVVHFTQADLQGDALDRVPASLFPFRLRDCELVGETSAAWVIVDRPPKDRPHWFFVDRTSGRIVREMTREGRRVITTTFDGFEPAGGTLRPRHWHVRDGNAENDLDVTVDEIVPAPLDDAAVGRPSGRRVFLPSTDANDVLTLPAQFVNGYITVEANVAGRHGRFILDTGTQSIILNASIERRIGSDPVLEHATVPSITVGPLRMNNVSVLAIPLGSSLMGLLGYDFFLGHVVHIDYANERVEVLSRVAADRVFADPRTTVVAANVEQGLPLVHAAFGAAAGDAFLIDTGSPRLFVMQPFVRRHAAQVAKFWSPIDRLAHVEDFLEGSIEVTPRRVAEFVFGPVRFHDIVANMDVPTSQRDAISIPFDGIIGSDELRFYDLWFDYDGGRIALQRNVTS